MYAFTQHRPTTLRQAASLLAKQEEAKLLAGGHTLIPTMKLRLAGPKNLVDLSKIEPQNISTTGDKVVIRLPDAEIFTSQLFDDRKCTYVVAREEGILLPPNTVLETAAREAAVANFKETALANGILEQARTNAEGELRRLLTLLGYRDIQFVK